MFFISSFLLDRNNSTIIAADIPASNGVIHVIDTVLLVRQRSGIWIATFLHVVSCAVFPSFSSPLDFRFRPLRPQCLCLLITDLDMHHGIIIMVTLDSAMVSPHRREPRITCADWLSKHKGKLVLFTHLSNFYTTTRQPRLSRLWLRLRLRLRLWIRIRIRIRIPPSILLLSILPSGDASTSRPAPSRPHSSGSNTSRPHSSGSNTSCPLWQDVRWKDEQLEWLWRQYVRKQVVRRQDGWK